jgi:hypothetical protein
MSSQNIDKVVKLACKPKNAPPKPKVSHIAYSVMETDIAVCGCISSSDLFGRWIPRDCLFFFGYASEGTEWSSECSLISILGYAYV